MFRYRMVVLAAMIFGFAVLRLSVGAAAPGSAKMPSAQDGSVVASARLSGTTRAASGQAMEGVAVSARAVDKTITTTVFTDEQGEYFFPPLESGTYRVWAQAVGHRTARADVKLDATRPSHQAFTLNTLEDFTQQLSGSEWIESLPDDTHADRRMREIFRVNCTECHQPSVILQNRFDEQGWLAIIERMDRFDGDVSEEVEGDSAPPPSTTIGYHKRELARYLARVRGPGRSPLKFKLHPRPTGDAARVVFTEYAVPHGMTPDQLARHDGSDWSQGTAAGGGGLHDIMADVNGNAWLTDSGGRGRTLTKIDVKTGQVTGFKVMARDGVVNLRVHGIGKDPNGVLWFDAYGPLGRLDPITETFQIFNPPPRMGSGAFLTTDADKNGKVWTGTRYGSLQFDPETKKFKYFQNVTPADGITYGMTVDAEGNGWWTTFWADIVNKADVKTGKTYEFRMRPPSSSDREPLTTPAEREFYESIGALSWGHVNTVPGVQGPRRMGADRNGTAVWVPLYYGMAVAKIDIKTHKVTHYPLPISAHPYFLVVDKNHMVWTNLMSDDRVAKFDPKMERWTFYKLPAIGCGMRHISVDDLRGDVWVPCSRGGKAVRLQFRTPAQLQSLKAAGADARR